MVNFPNEEELNKMTIPKIKAHIRDMNDHYAIRGYSKMNKSQMINAILTAHNRIRGTPAQPKKKMQPMVKSKLSKEDLKKKTKKQLISMLPKSSIRYDLLKKPELITIVFDKQ